MAKAKRKGGKRLNVAVIGVCTMGSLHTMSIRKKVPEMKLVAVCDTDPAIAKHWGAECKVPHFLSHKELLRAGLADAVIIATPHPSHPGITIDCLRAGVDVLCEKPLSERISTAEKMVREAKKRRRVLAVMFQRRFEPAIEAAFDFVRAGKLGALQRAVLISPEYRTQAYYDSGGWRATWSGEGGGVMMNQAPHVIDIFVQLAGLPKKVLGNCEIRYHNIEVEDLAEAMLRFPGGGTGSFYCSTNEPAPGQMIELYGDKGKVTWRDGQILLLSYLGGVKKHARTAREKWSRPETVAVPVKLPERDCGHHLAMRNFARHILRGEALMISGESALASLELTNAIMLSSWQKKEISLPLNRAAYDRELERKRKGSTFRKKTRISTQTDPKFK